MCKYVRIRNRDTLKGWEWKAREQTKERRTGKQGRGSNILFSFSFYFCCFMTKARSCYFSFYCCWMLVGALDSMHGFVLFLSCLDDKLFYVKIFRLGVLASFP